MADRCGGVHSLSSGLLQSTWSSNDKAAHFAGSQGLPRTIADMRLMKVTCCGSCGDCVGSGCSKCGCGSRDGVVAVPALAALAAMVAVTAMAVVAMVAVLAILAVLTVSHAWLCMGTHA